MKHILTIIAALLLVATSATAREFAVSGPQGGLSLKVSLPKGFDPVPLWCSEKYMDIYSNAEMHIVEGENHLIIRKQKEVIGIILDFMKQTLN